MREKNVVPAEWWSAFMCFFFFCRVSNRFSSPILLYFPFFGALSCSPCQQSKAHSNVEWSGGERRKVSNYQFPLELLEKSIWKKCVIQFGRFSLLFRFLISFAFPFCSVFYQKFAKSNHRRLSAINVACSHGNWLLWSKWGGWKSMWRKQMCEDNVASVTGENRVGKLIKETWKRYQICFTRMSGWRNKSLSFFAHSMMLLTIRTHELSWPKSELHSISFALFGFYHSFHETWTEQKAKRREKNMPRKRPRKIEEDEQKHQKSTDGRRTRERAG